MEASNKEIEMKLGTQTGSVMNHLAARGVIGQPEDYHSHVSRMLKRAHKLAIRED